MAPQRDHTFHNLLLVSTIGAAIAQYLRDDERVSMFGAVIAGALYSLTTDSVRRPSNGNGLGVIGTFFVAGALGFFGFVVLTFIRLLVFGP